MHKAARMGVIAAMAAIIFGVAYSAAQVMSLLKMLRPPNDLFWMFLPSLLLAPAFLVVMICIHYCVARELKVYTLSGVAFALLYAALVSLVYFSQLATVIPMQMSGEKAVAEQMLFQGKNIMVAIDCIGYGFMSMAALFVSFAFKTKERYKWLYRSFYLHGLLAPFIVASFFLPELLAIGALWMFTFPFAMITVIHYFNRKKVMEVSPHHVTSRKAELVA